MNFLLELGLPLNSVLSHLAVSDLCSVAAANQQLYDWTQNPQFWKVFLAAKFPAMLELPGVLGGEISARKMYLQRAEVLQRTALLPLNPFHPDSIDLTVEDNPQDRFLGPLPSRFRSQLHYGW